MKRSTVWIVAVILLLAVAVYYVLTSRTNPEIRWDVEPDYSENTDGIYGPRDQRYKPGGTGSWQDNGLDNRGRSKGVVKFGPIVSGGIGHKDSRATADFNCGDGATCTIKVRVSGTIVGSPTNDDERIKLKAERLNSNGNPIFGTAVVAGPHDSNDGTEEYTLVLNGCGDVRLTVSFEEDVNADNPEGIQNRFTISISSYSCEGVDI